MRLKKFVAAGLAAVLALSMAGCAPAVESCPAAEKETTPETSALAAPVYPEMAQYPDESAYWKKDGSFDDDGFSKVYDAWWADKRARNNLQLPDPDGMQRFLRASTGTMLAQGGGQNLVYSPLNVYMALSMLCECTDGNSRAQILTLLGQSDLASVRAQASALWNANYCADGAVTSVLASSLWLRDGTNYVQSTLDTLAKTYYASTFSGEMGSDDYNKVLQSWLNEQTGGLACRSRRPASHLIQIRFWRRRRRSITAPNGRRNFPRARRAKEPSTRQQAISRAILCTGPIPTPITGASSSAQSSFRCAKAAV